eukprot:TRINITY_DN2320_c0_g1_i1.p1 TRINITY_DN2320_c0_g1~~TRINITY_DN2320_c0_g1_i1.p1  ORF type:complete len:613 (+),score=110.23 TRINITY_DN2320_c0_g1_i1:45-1883(+)
MLHFLLVPKEKKISKHLVAISPLFRKLSGISLEKSCERRILRAKKKKKSPRTKIDLDPLVLKKPLVEKKDERRQLAQSAQLPKPNISSASLIKPIQQPKTQESSPRKSVLLLNDKEEKEKKIRDAVAKFAGTSRKTKRSESKLSKSARFETKTEKRDSTSILPKSLDQISHQKLHTMSQYPIGGSRSEDYGLKSVQSQELHRQLTLDLLPLPNPETDSLRESLSVRFLAQTHNPDFATDFSDINDLSPPSFSHVDLLQKLTDLQQPQVVPSLELSLVAETSPPPSTTTSAREGSSRPAFGKMMVERSFRLPDGRMMTTLKGLSVEVLSQIGKGGTATVFKASLSNQIVALKVLSLLSVKDRQKMKRVLAAEVDMMKELSHPNVIRYYGWFFMKKEQEINIMLEFVEGGSLTNLIQKWSRLSETVSAHVLHQVLRGLCYLHQHSIIHRDLKPDNMLVDPNTGLVKLIDFGTATKVLIQSCRRSVVGTPWYTAPEVIKEEEYSYPADIWSLGCSAIEMLSGKPPYSHLNAIATLFTMAESIPPIPTDISESFNDFIKNCLNLEYKKRTTAEVLLGHLIFVEVIPHLNFDSAKTMSNDDLTEDSEYLLLVKNLHN